MKWLNVKKTLSKCSVFTCAILVKDEQGNLWKKKHLCIYLKYMQKWKNKCKEARYYYRITVFKNWKIPKIPSHLNTDLIFECSTWFLVPGSHKADLSPSKTHLTLSCNVSLPQAQLPRWWDKRNSYSILMKTQPYHKSCF